MTDSAELSLVSEAGEDPLLDPLASDGPSVGVGASAMVVQAAEAVAIAATAAPAGSDRLSRHANMIWFDPLRNPPFQRNKEPMQLSYTIRPAQEDDLALLKIWRSKAHVARWWGEAEIEPEVDKLREPRIAMWLAELRSRPFAFIQDYGIRDWSPHHFDFLPAGSRGIDMYVGEADMLGVGHGSRLLRQHVDHLFRLRVPAVGIDPHPDNQAAMRAFEKAGFTVASGPLDTRWSRAILMTRYA